MRQHAEGNAAPDHQQPLAASDSNARGRYARNRQQDRECTVIHDQSAVIHDHSLNDNQVAAMRPPLSRSSNDRDWSARIRASILRLMKIDGICLDPDSYSKVAGKRHAAADSTQAFHDRVDRLQAATETAHKEYYSRLRDVYSVSTRKKMRLSLTTSTESPPRAAASCQSRHVALDTLAVAAATEQLNTLQALTKTKTKKTKRSSQRQNSPPERLEGTEQTRAAVHDPVLSKAVDKLMGTLSELLSQLHATSDSAAAEPILAAAASIALEAAEMRRCEMVALTRMAEIEERRQMIMQGLLEYSKRKEEREKDVRSNEHANTASDAQESGQARLASPQAAKVAVERQL